MELKLLRFIAGVSFLLSLLVFGVEYRSFGHLQYRDLFNAGFGGSMWLFLTWVKQNVKIILSPSL
ncbi:MAG: hypothetical protein A3J46_01205 [Candidatus Yanofskybacteria bacterium RIFCSPHIGHO2_02_FULL_41_11]|uniref:Uncharacterized protein n=1 Tax=Candidatus Yanofskybacteria bacterium RIFCSPHIGHO2_02_FULL_41_11 TaxID=1802675 RepID=A0A1F8F8B6_9BACT|nr:MAG: hypothetical protein A3J46_01205 [Candidatus Yanofskybacteria bacterium RIFCSPHIGHO2_02_FULL_41_11]